MSPLPPPPLTDAQRRDQALCAKLHPAILRVCAAFEAQNKGSAHAIMVTLVHVAAAVSKRCGMRTAEEFGEFARLVFSDVK